MNARNPLSIIVRDGMDYGEFFVAEREPQTNESRNYTSYSATWCCYSSYGVYGHHWSSMGSPFAEFIQGMGADYLLSKIGRKEADPDRVLKEVRRLIREARRENRITKDEAAEAYAECRRIEDETTGAFVLAMLYDSVEISRVGIEWCDMSTTSYDPQCLGFVRRIWPKFVEALKEHIPCET